ncbi:MAG TPA: cytochrome P450 [Novosphingobium sp.]
MNSTTSGCPFFVEGGDSKTAAMAAKQAKAYDGATVVRDFGMARDVLRGPAVFQAGRGAEKMKDLNPEHLSVFFLDGDIHKKRRGQIARYFTPKAMNTKYRPTMESSTKKLIDQLRRSGREQLDLLSFELACDVASEIIGLTNSDSHAMMQRIRKSFLQMGVSAANPKNSFLSNMKKLYRIGMFYFKDVVPAIKARQKERQDDVMSLLIDEGYTNKSILIECQTYGSAGMLTTREFIVVAAWHMFERDDLRQTFLDGDESVQFGILEEILRVDPVVTHIHRRAKQDFTGANGEQVKAGELYALELRSANLDEAVVGECPHKIDPERSKKQRMTSAWMSFGDGPHRCPGAQVALHETRVFLDALLRVPGIRLANPPTVEWTGSTYELHGAYVECDKA